MELRQHVCGTGFGDRASLRKAAAWFLPTSTAYDLGRTDVEIGLPATAGPQPLWDFLLFSHPRPCGPEARNFREAVGTLASSSRYYHKQRGLRGRVRPPELRRLAACHRGLPVKINQLRFISQLRDRKCYCLRRPQPAPAVMAANPFQPHMARIVRIYRMVENNYLFTLGFLDDRLASSSATGLAQFMMLEPAPAPRGARSPSHRRPRAPASWSFASAASAADECFSTHADQQPGGPRVPTATASRSETMTDNEPVLIVAGGLGMAPLAQGLLV